LVVEDEYFVALEAEAQLTEGGVEVIGIAATAERAIELARQHQPDLVIMDIRLAGSRDGVDAAIELAEAGIPSVFATAHADEHTRRRAEAASPLGWVPKPYTGETLLKAVTIALATRSGGTT
jgi:DNA-binding NarL/FixJ family response regulator